MRQPERSDVAGTGSVFMPYPAGEGSQQDAAGGKRAGERLDALEAIHALDGPCEHWREALKAELGALQTKLALQSLKTALLVGLVSALGSTILTTGALVAAAHFGGK